MGKILALIVCIFILYKCTGGGFGTDSVFGVPDELPLSRYEDLYVNVWFYFEDGKQSYQLGRTKGASSCGNMARAYAHEKNLNSSDWSYVCCTEENGSDCYRKIR